jgi:hypothetical protein
MSKGALLFAKIWEYKSLQIPRACVRTAAIQEFQEIAAKGLKI